MEPVICWLHLLGCSEPKQPKCGGTQRHRLCPRGSAPDLAGCAGLVQWDLGAAGRREGAEYAAGAGGMLCPRQHHRHLLLSSDFSAPTPVTDIRTDKVEQKSVSLSWQEPGFPTANGTEYEVKYYEKVGSGDRLWLSVVPQPPPPRPIPGHFPRQPDLPLGSAGCCVCRGGCCMCWCCWSQSTTRRVKIERWEREGMHVWGRCCREGFTGT